MAFGFLLFALLTGAALAQFSRPAAQCPGYRAINVVRSDSYLTANLTLIGNCSSHGSDIQDLRLLVEYQTSRQTTPYTRIALTHLYSARHPPACFD